MCLQLFFVLRAFLMRLWGLPYASAASEQLLINVYNVSNQVVQLLFFVEEYRRALRLLDRLWQAIRVPVDERPTELRLREAVCSARLGNVEEVSLVNPRVFSLVIRTCC